MSDINLFSINAIALDIAENYYLKEYPTICKDNALAFTENSSANRGAFGNIPVSRIAALIPYIIKIYIDYKDSFNTSIKTQIDKYLTGKSIKILQIVALMQASGRWRQPKTDPTVDPASVYETQSILECKKKLEMLGVDVGCSNEFAMLLKSNFKPENEPYLLYYAILQDAIVISGDGKANEIESMLKTLQLTDENTNKEIRTKLLSLIQGVNIAKIRQQAAIVESATSFHPITLSFKRIFNSLFPNMEETLAELEKKVLPIPTNSSDINNITVPIAEPVPTVTAMINNVITDVNPAMNVNLSPSIDVSLSVILQDNQSLNEITQAINDFTNNVDDIQNKLGDKKAEYAQNLYQAWKQTWDVTFAAVMVNANKQLVTPNAEILVRWYLQELLQNLDPAMDVTHMDLIMQFDKEQLTDYGDRLALLMLIKVQAGKQLTVDERNFINTHGTNLTQNLQHNSTPLIRLQQLVAHRLKCSAV